MKKTIFGLISALIAMMCVTSCNSDDDTPEEVEIKWSDVAVTAFSLGKDDSVLVSLDSVFFAIDLDNAQIYNPDSLPKGTKIDTILVNLTYATVSKAELKFRTNEGVDTVKDITTSSGNDTVNFANGPVILKLTSLDEKVTRDYTIRINVHNMAPDSLAWGDVAYTRLPGASAPVAQHTTATDNNEAACFVLDSENNLFRTTSESQEVRFGISTDMGKAPAGFDINTVTIADGKIYAVANGRLMRYESKDNWTDLAPMNWIYGNFDGKLLGVRTSTEGYVTAAWPSDTETAISYDFPVSGTSQMLVYSSEWSTEPLAIIIGGTKADGTPSGDTWAYDGSSWLKISSQSLPAATGMTIIPYFTFRTSTRWIVTKRTTLFAFGGLKADGTCQSRVYVSYDRGMHWSAGQDLVQLPKYIAPRYDAQAVVIPQTKTVSRSASVWTECDTPSLPRWLRVDSYSDRSRATKPLTEWECPYIYLFGGRSSDGTLYDEVWRGVINRLSFVPLY